MSNEIIAQNDEVLAQIIRENGEFFVIDQDSEKKGPCKFCDADDKTIVLPKNASNRQWYNRAKADRLIDETGYAPLYYKVSKTFGPRGDTVPNAKLIAYLSEEEQAEFKAIVARAKEAKAEADAKPLTELEKAQAKMERAKAAYEKALAAADAMSEKENA